LFIRCKRLSELALTAGPYWPADRGPPLRNKELSSSLKHLSIASVHCEGVKALAQLFPFPGAELRSIRLEINYAMENDLENDVQDFKRLVRSLNANNALQLLNFRFCKRALDQLPPNIRFLRLESEPHRSLLSPLLADDVEPAGVLDNVRALALTVHSFDDFDRFRKYMFSIYFIFIKIILFIFKIIN
jgi:hypothetical protein